MITNSTNVHGPAVFQFISHPQIPVSWDFTNDKIAANTVYNKIFLDWQPWQMVLVCLNCLIWLSAQDFTQFCHWENFKIYNTVYIIKQIWDKPIYSTLWHLHNILNKHTWKVTDQTKNHKHCQKTYIVLYTTLPIMNASYVYTPHYYTLLKFIILIYTTSKNKPGQKHCERLWPHLPIHFCTNMNTTNKFKLSRHHPIFL